MRYSPEDGMATLEVKFVEVDNEFPTLVFLHDSLGCIELWRDFPELLAYKLKCNYLVYDRLGYGKSTRDKQLPNRGNNYHEVEADRLIGLINDFNLQKPILFGHSDGGTSALIAAAKAPNLIKGVITEGAHIFTEERTLNGIIEAKSSYRDTDLRNKLYKYHGERVDDLVPAWINIWLHDSFKNWNIEGFLPQIICPTLVIQGEKDEFGTLNQVEGILKGLSGFGEKLIIPNCGHTPHKESKNVVLEQCALFIEDKISKN
jgi:pimeloyl-ACP methyl ester carboxylesterase